MPCCNALVLMIIVHLLHAADQQVIIVIFLDGTCQCVYLLPNFR